ncbi:hypothetical protein [Duganella sp. BuS-21]|uniref:hypothetical protein n=1 Tax=Duganella sp. BuS-21 TaxID=2943848 RepID=UPI0035A6920E
MPLLLCCTTAVATAAPDQQEQDMLKSLRNNLARSFLLAPELPLDPALRSAADEIANAHLARIDALLPAWLEEERKLQSTGGKQAAIWYVYFAVWARVLNELALWQIEPGDAAYESATQAALKASPQVCDLHGDNRFSDYAARIARIQQVPVAQRAALLSTERELLSRWAKPRATAAPWPDPLPQDAAVALLKAIPVQPARLALPPVLASQLLGGIKPYDAMAREEQCLLQQWWFKHSLQQGVAPATALNAFRYGTMISADVRLAGMFNPQQGQEKGKSPYPAVATRFQAEGSTIGQIRLGAGGKPQQASVIARKIVVPGIREVRPLAFENLFDAATLKYGMESKPAAGGPLKFQLVWTLDGERP